MVKKRSSKKKRTLFSPDEIVTKIHQAIKRDLGGSLTLSSLQEYEDAQSVKRYFADRQCTELLKKYCAEGGVGQDALELKTFEKFLEVNEHMRAYREITLPTSNRISRHTPEDQKVLLRARALMGMVLSPFTMVEWAQECKHSTGSSIGVPFTDTSMERKFIYPISTTANAKPIFDVFLRLDQDLGAAVEELNHGTVQVAQKYDVVVGSRATTVEKNDSIRRMIAVEPTANMYLQQGLMNMMYRRMAKVGLDVQSLPNKHKVLALLSSLTHENATIDWSSASDCVSIGLLHWLLPERWWAAVDVVRCDTMTVKGQDVQLNMFSTMGNAVTFPLETLVFWTIGHAVLLSEDTTTNTLFPEWEDLGMVSVFGDDCIVPTSLAVKYMEAMSRFGFIVNNEKSFFEHEGFRESCGGDYLHGYDVRPLNIRAPVSTSMSALEPWLYIMMNGFYKKYISYFGPLTYVYDKELWRTFAQIFSDYGLQLRLVPGYYPDDSGFQMSEDILRFTDNYQFRLAKIGRSEHGTYHFSYCSFRYHKKYRYMKHDGLRYNAWLRHPAASNNTDDWALPKRVGGYVVAKSTSVHWTIPTKDCGGFYKP